MLNRTTFRSPSLTTQAVGLGDEQARPLLERGRTQALARLLQLPTSVQGYTMFVACLLILAFTMVLHITLSAEIMRMEVQIGALEEEYARIEQSNANVVWQIAGFSSLHEIQAKATRMNYNTQAPVKYVVAPQQPAAGATGSEADTAGSPAVQNPDTPSATDGRLLVLTQPESSGEPDAQSVAAEPAPSEQTRTQRMADTLMSWLREFVPGQYQPAP